MNRDRTFNNRRTGYQYRSKARRDQPRDAVFQTLRRVEEDDAFANLVLPIEIERHHLNRRDAAFATELAYGTLRLQGRYDAILSRLTDRPLKELDPEVMTVLRMGTHEILGMRVENYAAVDSSVDLARDRISSGPAGMINAVLRRVTQKPLEEWLDLITAGLSEEKSLAVAFSYPEWIVWALKDSLVASGREAAELPQLLHAQNAPAYVTLSARPTLVTADELATAAETYLDVDTRLGELSREAVVISGGDPRRLRLVTRGYAGVEDEGSQFLVDILTAVPVSGTERTWVDLCAGPGGKTALLAGFAKEKDVSVIANEVAEHRAELVKDSVKALRDTVTVITGDGRDFGAKHPGKADRVLVDAPCSGLGSLRRRPEARWRKQPADLQDLAPLQRDLLHSAAQATKPGGVLAYATCSPHLSETRALVQSVLEKREDLELLDATEFAKLAAVNPAHDFGPGPFLQLWPDRDDTDAMFMALMRKQETHEN
ncbi:MAG: transcription antitermination factor NusB [Mobiluncus porci]|uniref:RsmB/NOP family class I SAM-dependent RNA methyltransferase n=1 Tax=Mobiluncus TaxID=2050 RepID=UPI0023F1C964|nr:MULTISPECIES: transcription antitermination factor NusB [Mobiluncus]MCI6585381.1 16S rRNA methyltransferase [Mobiluncus sp.]MDD7541410.1 transcription antitermination factor NusB [Mobiluncus porci]MDY5748395.1 transcription antitermination factor NusB [Mobiluncus porci]